MKNSTISWILVVVFFTTTVLFAGLYLSERHTLQKAQTAFDLAKKSEAELRGSIQAAQAVAKDNVSQLAAEGRQALSGIYYCQQAVVKNEVDLRSDGSAVWLNDSSGQKFGSAKWTTDGDTVTVGATQFRIEGSDFIDSRGNRWLHIR
jgi:hypothetical protein